MYIYRFCVYRKSYLLVICSPVIWSFYSSCGIVRHQIYRKGCAFLLSFFFHTKKNQLQKPSVLALLELQSRFGGANQPNPWCVVPDCPEDETAVHNKCNPSKILQASFLGTFGGEKLLGIRVRHAVLGQRMQCYYKGMRARGASRKKQVHTGRCTRQEIFYSISCMAVK